MGGHTGAFGRTFATLCRLWRRVVRSQGKGCVNSAFFPWRLPPRLRDWGLGAPGVGWLNGQPRPAVFPLGLIQVPAVGGGVAFEAVACGCGATRIWLGRMWLKPFCI